MRGLLNQQAITLVEVHYFGSARYNNNKNNNDEMN
jgi:hypothetical protein